MTDKTPYNTVNRRLPLLERGGWGDDFQQGRAAWLLGFIQALQ